MSVLIPPAISQNNRITRWPVGFDIQRNVQQIRRRSHIHPPIPNLQPADQIQPLNKNFTSLK